MRMRRPLGIALVLALLPTFSSAQVGATPLNAQAASVPRLIKFSGTLRDGSGSAVTGTVGVVFAVYSASEGGAPLWLETQSVTADSAGKYSVLLGASRADGISQDVFSSGEARWLGVQVEGQPEQPRTLLVSVPYALKASDAETLGGKPASAYMLANSVPGESAALNTSTAPTQIIGLSTVNTTTGTQNSIPVFVDNAGTLGNSLLLQSGSSIGMGGAPGILGLDVVGGVRASTGLATGGRGISPDAINTNALFIEGSNAMGGIPLAGNNVDLVFGPGQIFSLVSFYAGGSERMTVDGATGNVGIGTTLPTQKLDVNGLVRAAGGFKFGDGTTQTTAAAGGTITGVTAGTGLTGGGTSGTVTLNLATPVAIGSGGTGLSSAGSAGSFLRSNGSAFQSSAIQVSDLPPNIAFTNASNNFNANQTITGTLSLTGAGTMTGIGGNFTGPNGGLFGFDTVVDGSGHVGVFGRSDDTAGAGVQGVANSLTGNTIGAFGLAKSTNGLGVLGKATAVGGIGVKAVSLGGCSGTGVNAFCSKILSAADGNQEVFAVSTNGVHLKSAINVPIGNDTTTGTTTNLLVKITANGQGIVTATGDVGGAIGVAGFNAGLAGQALVAVIGVANCQFDNQSVTADYAVIGPSGQCHDAGANYPSGVQVLGRVAQPNVGPGTVGQVYFFGSEARGFAGKRHSFSALSFTNFTGGSGIATLPTQGRIQPNSSNPATPTDGYMAFDAPDGAAISAVTVCGSDMGDADYFLVRLKRKSLDPTQATNAPDTIATATSPNSASPGNICETTTSITNGVVDKTNFVYYLELELGGAVQVVSVQVDD